MKFKIALFLIALSSASIFAQKTISTDEHAWFGLLNQTRISNRWGIWFDGHLRLKDNYVGDLSQGIVRAGPIFYLSDDVRLTAAYAYVRTFPAAGHEDFSLHEHRPWQQVMWYTRSSNARLTQSIRLEEQFKQYLTGNNELGEGYRFNWRVRYNFILFLPITKKRFESGSLQFVTNNEVFINFGNNIIYNHFDQNRFFAGLAFQVNKNAQLHGGYMNLFQQLGSGDHFRRIHAFRMFYFHNFDLR